MKLALVISALAVALTGCGGGGGGVSVLPMGCQYQALVPQAVIILLFPV
jgi:hypothetical protein